jgi:glycerol-3-phosphate acyltransferase PlsY
MIGYLVMVPLGYFLGALPFGILVGRVFKRIDVRDFGSGSSGTTNVLRTVGAPAAALVLFLDMGKCVVAVVLARLVSDSSGVEAAGALAALTGHNWPVFIGFRGGRGTAPGWGGLVILSPLSGLLATVVGLSAIGATRYVSLGSLLGATSGSAMLIVLAATGHAPTGYIWFAAIGTTVIVARHADNIRRLRAGRERKLGESAKTTGGDGETRRRKGMRWPRSA